MLWALWIAVKYVDLVDPAEVVVEMPNSPLLVLVSYQKFKSGGGGWQLGKKSYGKMSELLLTYRLGMYIKFRVSERWYLQINK
jgi:hypothetical protein